MTPQYTEAIRHAWSILTKIGHYSSRPYGPKEFARARQLLDGRGWIPWKKIHSVLCLASGGGQQGPLFASMGYEVCVADISPDQLELDREVAKNHGFEIECLECDMLDLSPLNGRKFDLVYQAGSACYVPDVHRMYQQVAQVVKPGGLYRVEHWNPAHLQLAEQPCWDGEAYRIAHPQTPGAIFPWNTYDEQTGELAFACNHYLHPLSHLLGGLCNSGFAILRFAESGPVDASAEPGTYEHLGLYLSAFYVMLARYHGSISRS